MEKYSDRKNVLRKCYLIGHRWTLMCTGTIIDIITEYICFHFLNGFHQNCGNETYINSVQVWTEKVWLGYIFEITMNRVHPDHIIHENLQRMLRSRSSF